MGGKIEKGIDVCISVQSGKTSGGGGGGWWIWHLSLQAYLACLVLRNSPCGPACFVHSHFRVDIFQFTALIDAVSKSLMKNVGRGCRNMTFRYSMIR